MLHLPSCHMHYNLTSCHITEVFVNHPHPRKKKPTKLNEVNSSLLLLISKIFAQPWNENVAISNSIPVVTCTQFNELCCRILEKILMHTFQPRGNTKYRKFWGISVLFCSSCIAHPGIRNGEQTPLIQSYVNLEINLLDWCPSLLLKLQAYNYRKNIELWGKLVEIC